MPRPIQATIHTAALRHNLGVARQAAPDAQAWAVVKANAYGHGIERVFEGLRGADGFALLDLSEAERVRALGWRGPILLLEGAFEPRDLELCSRLNLWHTVHREAQIDWLAAHKTQQPHHVFLKMNSGMNRLGFTPTAFRGAWARLNALPQVDEISLMTHFSDADAARGTHAAALPFAASSLDLVVLPHALELARDPHHLGRWRSALVLVSGTERGFAVANRIRDRSVELVVIDVSGCPVG